MTRSGRNNQFWLQSIVGQSYALWEEQQQQQQQEEEQAPNVDDLQDMAWSLEFVGRMIGDSRPLCIRASFDMDDLASPIPSNVFEDWDATNATNFTEYLVHYCRQKIDGNDV